MRTGGVEPPQPRATGLHPAELADAQRPHEEGRPTGLEPVPRGSRPRMLPLHHGHRETGTTGLEPAAYRLTSERSPSELRPREWRGWDSNPRSRAHGAREDSRSSTARRTPPAGLEPAASGLRARRHLPSDHGGTGKLRRQASNLRFAINSRASFPLDYTGTSGRGGSRTPKARRAHPFSRRDTAPMAALPGQWLRQESNLHNTD